MALPRAIVHRYTRKLYRFLRERPKFTFKHMRVYRGWIDLDDSPVTVTLEPRSAILTTLIHEFLHHEHPDWSESRILRMEDTLMNSLTERQVRNVVKRFAEAI